MIITVIFRRYEATRPRVGGVACTIGKANNLTNLHCIQRETKPTCPRLAIHVASAYRSIKRDKVIFVSYDTMRYEMDMLC